MDKMWQKSRSPPCTPAFDGSGSDLEDAGCFLDPISQHVHQNEREALVWGELVQGRVYVHGRVTAGRRVRAGALGPFVGQYVQSDIVGRYGGPHHLATHPVMTCVDDDAMQPGTHLGLAAETVRSAECRKKGLLERVGRFFRIAEDPDGNSPHALSVSPD